MFQSYEEDFSRIFNSLQRKIDLAPGQNSQTRESSISEGSKELQEAEKCVSSIQIRQMEIEISMLSANSRPAFTSKVRRYRDDYEEMRRNFRNIEIKSTDQRNRDTLMGSMFDSGLNNQKEKLIQREGNALSQQIMRLEQGKKAALEAEGIAIDTMNQLKGQREVLDRAVMNNREVSDNLSQGNRVLNSIMRRNIQNKLIMFGIAIMLLGAIVFLVYMKLA